MDNICLKNEGKTVSSSYPPRSSNSGHLDWKACKIRVFRSFFLLRDTKMTLRKWLRTFITSKVDAVEIPVGLCYYLFGTIRMVGG